MSAQSSHPEIIPATGLTIVVPHDNPTLDIVFVHGFTGHPERTWKHKRGDAKQSDDDDDETSEPPSKAPRFNPFSTIRQGKDSARSAVYWPRDLLPETVPNARILTYGYDTHIRHWAGPPVSRNTVRDIAWDFLVALEAGRREEPSRPLLFIVHSLGGIVVKELLRRSSGCRRGQDHLRYVFESTVGIMFFGTPHGGADPRGILQHVAELVIKAVGFKVNDQIVNTLLPSSERLRELRDEFSPMAHEQQWIIHSFQEQLAVKALNNRKVVEDTSSYLNFPAIEITEHIGQNHMDMCRFSGPGDVEYRKVADALRRMIANFPKTRIFHASPSIKLEDRQQLRDSLGFDEIDNRYATIKRAHVKTCKWLKKKDEYLDWLDPSKITQHHGFFWIKGNPGTGKSTLMKFAFDQARRTKKDKIILSFFFNARGEELEKSTIGMYRSLLLQLLQHIPSLEAIFDSLPLTTRSQSGRIQWSVELLKDLLEQAVQNLGQLWVVCFIDALDECNEDEAYDMVSFFEHIGALAVESNIRFQVCFSSRHYPYISIAHGLELVLEGLEGHKQDIANYIDCELKIGHSKVAEDIRAELQAKASGVFMWIVLVVEILNKEYARGRIHALRKRLQEIPDRLHDLFRDILTRDTRDRDELILCIQWVLFAKSPLRPEELYFAVIAGTSYESIAPWDRELASLDIIERFIIDSSKGLAEATKSKAPVVQFIHESIRDFLLKDNGLQEILPNLGDHFQGQSHDKLKECCLKHIYVNVAGHLRLPQPLPKPSSREAAGIRDSIRESFPFLNYAACNILYHMNEAESEGIAQTGFLNSFPIQKWIYLHNLFENSNRRQLTLDGGLLLQAAKDGYVAIAKLLIDAGATIDGIDHAGRTPLYWATWRGHFAVAKLLVEEGANKDILDVEKMTPISRASMDGRFDIVKLLITAGADKEVKDKDNLTLLSQASMDGHFDIVKLLITAGADKEAKDKYELTPLLRAAQGGHLEIIKLLIGEGANQEVRDIGGRTVFTRAAKEGHLELVKLLIKEGADKEVQDQYGETPLLTAALSGHLDVVRLLIKEGANQEAKDFYGKTPLSLAVQHGHLEAVELLIETGANIEIRDQEKQTPLFLAVSNEYLGVAGRLIEAGADTEARGNTGRTPLHEAVCIGNSLMVEILVKAGADRGARDDKGQTLLHDAAVFGSSEMVELLFNAGVDKEVKDRYGRTPLSLAIEGCNSKVI